MQTQFGTAIAEWISLFETKARTHWTQAVINVFLQKKIV